LELPERLLILISYDSNVFCDGYIARTPSRRTRSRDHNIDVDRGCEVASEQDLLTLIEAQFGVAIAPRSLRTPATLSRTPIEGLELSRTVCVYGVAGRQRTPVASAMLKMLRAYDWSTYLN
jgi:hypothetical protein